MIKSLFVLLALTSPAAARTVSYAIAIGNNAPPTPTLPTLRYADDDAVRYYQLFGRVAERASLLTVLDPTSQRRYPALRPVLPTRAHLAAIVADYAARMADDVRRGDRPVLYLTFSGHGAAADDGTPYLAMLDEPGSVRRGGVADGARGAVADGALTRDRLYREVIGKLPAAYVHLIVDACNAGAVVGVRGPVELESRAVELTLSERLAIDQGEQRAWPTVGVVLAATAGQEAHEWSQLEAGVFSHEVISGLLGAADANRDGAIEYSELAAFIASANRNIPDPRAAPQVVARPPASDRRAPLIALDALQSTIYLTGDASPLGHFYVELANGQRYLDANVATQVRLALPADASLYIRTTTREAEVAARHTGVAIADLQFRPMASQGRGSVDVAYRLGLFRHVYGEAYYAGFVDSSGLPSVSFAPPPTGSVRVTGIDFAIHAAPARGRDLPLGLAIGGGVAGATAIVSGALAYDAWRDNRDTQIQRDARDAMERYHRDLAISITSGVLAIGAGVASYWLWPSREPAHRRAAIAPSVTPSVTPQSATISLTSQF